MTEQGFSMNEVFTDRVVTVAELADEEAARSNRGYIGSVGSVHVLLGLAREGSSLSANVLKGLGAQLCKIRLEIEKLVRNGQDQEANGFVPILEHAVEQASQFGHNYIGTEHILLGLLREGAAATVLRTLGLKPEEVRRQLLDLLGTGEWDLAPPSRRARDNRN